MSDLAFQRHVLVQALIVIDFILSLAPKSKQKLEKLTDNPSVKSLLASYTLNDNDVRLISLKARMKLLTIRQAEWAQNTRERIASYLREGPDGPFFYRMIDTVLSRDKNWYRWKAERCPPISKDSMTADDFVQAKVGAQKAATSRRLKPVPMGSLDLSFLSPPEGDDLMERLKNPARLVLTPRS